MSPKLAGRALAVVAALTAAVIGFIAGFSSNPALSYPWAVPIILACVGVGLACVWGTEWFVKE